MFLAPATVHTPFNQPSVLFAHRKKLPFQFKAIPDDDDDDFFSEFAMDDDGDKGALQSSWLIRPASCSACFCSLTEVSQHMYQRCEIRFAVSHPGYFVACLQFKPRRCIFVARFFLRILSF